MTDRRITSLDRLIGQLDQALHSAFGPAPPAKRRNPATDKNDAGLTAAELALAGRLMRVNHVGEICAQALYQGQSLTARLPAVRGNMEQAAQEENDHLAWTEERLRELQSHSSYLNPLWYAGSFAIGALAGAMGDKWSLGFVAEAEHQVVEHLSNHLKRLPTADERSRSILEQMRADESHHATVAMASGAAVLPKPVSQLMRCASKFMTGAAYWI